MVIAKLFSSISSTIYPVQQFWKGTYIVGEFLSLLYTEIRSCILWSCIECVYSDLSQVNSRRSISEWPRRPCGNGSMYGFIVDVVSTEPANYINEYRQPAQCCRRGSVFYYRYMVNRLSCITNTLSCVNSTHNITWDPFIYIGTRLLLGLFILR